MPRSSKAMTKLEKATAAYLHNCEAVGVSKTTMDNYSTRLNAFIQYLWENDMTLQDPSFSTIQEWRDDLLSSGKKPSTVKQYLVELRAFFAWASDPEMGDERYYEKNPVAKTLMPNTTKQDKRPYDMILTDEQVMRLWRNVKPAGRYYNWPRNYAMVIMFLTTDIRNSELTALTLNDLDFEQSEIVINRGKGNKYRVVDFPEIAQTAVKLYLESGYRPADAKPSDLLFGSFGERKNPHKDYFTQFDRGSISRFVERHVYLVTGVSGVTSHDLRHVGARLDLNSGMSLEELQAKLGHESMNTTQIYSGKLLPRKNRASALRTLEEQKIQAKRNAEKLRKMECRA